MLTHSFCELRKKSETQQNSQNTHPESAYELFCAIIWENFYFTSFFIHFSKVNSKNYNNIFCKIKSYYYNQECHSSLCTNQQIAHWKNYPLYDCKFFHKEKIFFLIFINKIIIFSVFLISFWKYSLKKSQFRLLTDAVKTIHLCLMTRSTNREKSQRQNRAFELLADGQPINRAAEMLIGQFGISLRQAHRYLREAQRAGHLIPIAESTIPMTIKIPKDIALMLRTYARANNLISLGLNSPPLAASLLLKQADPKEKFP